MRGMKMTVPMPRGLPPEGQVFLRMGVKTETGSSHNWDGKWPRAFALDLWVTLCRGPAPVGADEGIEQAFRP